MSGMQLKPPLLFEVKQRENYHVLYIFHYISGGPIRHQNLLMSNNYHIFDIKLK
jgi:hypothetical protein